MRCMTSNGICRGFAFKYGKFPLPLRYCTALSGPKVPTRVQYHVESTLLFCIYLEVVEYFVI